MSTSQKRRETGNLKPNYNYIAQAKTSELRQENQMVLAKEEPLLYTRMYRKNWWQKTTLCANPITQESQYQEEILPATSKQLF